MAASSLTSRAAGSHRMPAWWFVAMPMAKCGSPLSPVTARHPGDSSTPSHGPCPPEVALALPAPDTIVRTAVPSLNRGSQMAEEDLKAELERLKAENERLKSQRGRSVSLKVSEKGGVSVYGLGRFPVTLYKEQWQKLLAMADEIRAFIKEHDTELKAKPQA